MQSSFSFLQLRSCGDFRCFLSSALAWIAFIRSFKAISFQIASLFGQDALDSWRSRFTVTDWEQERAFMFGDFDVPLFFGIYGFLMLLALAVFVPFFVIYSTQAKLADVPESVKKSWKDTGQVFVALAGVIVFLLSAWTMFRVVSDRFPDEWQTPLVAQYEKQTLNKIYYPDGKVPDEDEDFEEEEIPLADPDAIPTPELSPTSTEEQQMVVPVDPSQNDGDDNYEPSKVEWWNELDF